MLSIHTQNNLEMTMSSEIEMQVNMSIKHQNEEQPKYLSNKMAQAIANSIFPELDTALRAGRHIGLDELEQHTFLMDFQAEFEQFYQRYNVELILASEGFFYLRPCSTTLIARSVLSELDMMIGKVLCYLYLSPERLAHEGIFTLQVLHEELLTLADENKLLKLVNQRSSGSDLDRQRLYDRVKRSLNRLRRLGMLSFVDNSNSKFRIAESIFRFGADVRRGDDMQEAQLRMIRDGEAIQIERPLSLSEVKNEAEQVDEQTEA